MTDRTWLDEREELAWRALVRMQAHLTSELARRLAAESSLSYPDYEVLVALTDQHDGHVRLFQLAEDLGWEKSRLSHHITRMVERGLVAKERCPHDGRGYVLAVTDDGRATIAAAAPGHAAAVRELFINRLTPAQLDTITRAATAVLPGLDPGPPAGRRHSGR